MLLNLIKLRLKALIAGFGSAVRGKGKAAKVGFTLLMVYAFGVCALSMGMTMYSLAEPLNSMGLDWLYFALASSLGMMMCLVGSIFTCKAQIYSAKDNELLLAMPIKPTQILLARIISITVLNWFYCAITTLPAVVVWFIAVGFDAGILMRFIPMYLLLPLIAESLGCLLGWLLSLVERKVANKNLMSTLGMILFLVAYFVLVSKMESFLPYLMENGAQVAAGIAPILPIYSFGMAVAGDALHFGLFSAMSLGAIGITVWLLARSFSAIALTPSSTRRKNAKIPGYTLRSPARALLSKELRRFVSSPMYMLNAGLGIIMMPIAAVSLSLKGDMLDELTAAFPAGMDFPIEAMVAVLLAVLASMVFISAPSISLEGKNLWLSRSLPVPTGDILLAKARCHYLLCLPVCLVSSVICGAGLGAKAAMWPALVLLPMVQSVFCALTGVAINLHFPKFDWVNEVQAVKQGMSTMVTMLLGVASVITPVVLYAALLAEHISADIAVYLWAALLSIACLLIRLYLTRGGARRYEALAG